MSLFFKQKTKFKVEAEIQRYFKKKMQITQKGC